MRLLRKYRSIVSAMLALFICCGYYFIVLSFGQNDLGDAVKLVYFLLVSIFFVAIFSYKLIEPRNQEQEESPVLQKRISPYWLIFIFFVIVFSIYLFLHLLEKGVI